MVTDNLQKATWKKKEPSVWVSLWIAFLILMCLALIGALSHYSDSVSTALVVTGTIIGFLIVLAAVTGVVQMIREELSR